MPAMSKLVLILGSIVFMTLIEAPRRHDMLAHESYSGFSSWKKKSTAGGKKSDADCQLSWSSIHAMLRGG
jgi:hypothetical protein